MEGRIAGLQPKARRLLVAIAGPPASGKSTLAAALVDRLGARAALVPMDGFHLDNRILDARGWRARKGAPHTFDAVGFVHLIRRLGVEDEVLLPVFDRSLDMSIAGAEVVGPETEICVVEGNYLLLDQAPWTDLHGLWDLSVFLDVSLDEIDRRAVARWDDHGWPRDKARAHIDVNDLPNARLVLEESVVADIRL